MEQQIKFNDLKFMHSYFYDYCPKSFKRTWKLNKDMNKYKIILHRNNKYGIPPLYTVAGKAKEV